MKRLEGIPYNDRDKLYVLLNADDNFTYSMSEGAFYTNDDVFIGIDRDPYFGCLYASSDIGENNIDKWKNYILSKWDDYCKTNCTS